MRGGRGWILALKLGSTDFFKEYLSYLKPQLIFVMRLLDKKNRIQYYHASSITLFILGSKHRNSSLIFHNRGDPLIVTMCAWGGIHSRYRNRAVEREEREQRDKWRGRSERLMWGADGERLQTHISIHFPERLSEVTSLSPLGIYIVCLTKVLPPTAFICLFLAICFLLF